MATLINVIDFLAGFQDDEMQTGIPDLILAAEQAESLLIRNLSAWQDEEDSVQGEHRALIEDTANYLDDSVGPVTHSQLAEVIRNIVSSSNANDAGSLANAIKDANALVLRMGIVEPVQRHEITILWGEQPEEGDEAETYSFATKAELDAFNEGVNEMDGWAGWQVVDKGYVHHINQDDA